MTDAAVLAVGAGGDPGGVFAALSAAFAVHAEPAETVQWTWLDTADWRLHRVGLALREERGGRVRELVLERPGDPHLTTSVQGVTWPARLDRLPDSVVRAAIADVVGVRALLPVAEVEVRRILLRLMDDAAKTRVRVSLEQQRLLMPRRAALPLHIVVQALRGYRDDARRCVTLLGEAMDAQLTSLSPTEAALAAAGHVPDAGAAIEDDVPLDPSEPALRLVARALLRLLRTVDDAREGALADLDTEFLHDFRTAVRSTRALLGPVGELLPGRSAVRVERDLSWLDESTEAMRSVDLALLGVGGDADLDISGLAGFDDADVLEPLRTQLHRRRRTELRRMRQTLRAPRAPAAFTVWRADLERMVEADLIGVSAREAARNIIDRSRRDLVAAGPHDVMERVAQLREVLRAFAPLRSAIGTNEAGAGAAAAIESDVDIDVEPDGQIDVEIDVETLHQQFRQRDGLRLTAGQVRAATAVGELPRATVLAAGALLDRAARRESELDHEITQQLSRIIERSEARR